MLNKDFLLKNIKNNLANIEPNLALQYLIWLDKKTIYFKDSVLKNGYGLQPDNLKRGDIVWVEFGINIGNELSDIFTKGHYALVWQIDLGNAVVIPLTSRNSYNSPLCLNLGVIKGLDNDKNTNSYLKLDAIRSISKRRIQRIANIEKGKIELDNNQLRMVKKHIYTHFIEEHNYYMNNLDILNYIAYHIENI